MDTLLLLPVAFIPSQPEPGRKKPGTVCRAGELEFENMICNRFMQTGSFSGQSRASQPKEPQLARSVSWPFGS